MKTKPSHLTKSHQLEAFYDKTKTKKQSTCVGERENLALNEEFVELSAPHNIDSGYYLGQAEQCTFLLGQSIRCVCKLATVL